jgi:hypothetical protein
MKLKGGFIGVKYLDINSYEEQKLSINTTYGEHRYVVSQTVHTR